MCTTSVGSPTDCVLSPLLYILYTNDCKTSYPGKPLVMFADDTALVILQGVDRGARASLGGLFDLVWQLSLSSQYKKRPKRCSKTSPQNVVKGQDIKVVEEQGCNFHCWAPSILTLHFWPPWFYFWNLIQNEATVCFRTIRTPPSGRLGCLECFSDWKK